jgi:hypothetical protein
MLAIKKSQENRKTYVCKKCDYDTCNKYDFVKHNNTEKHISNNLSIIDNDFSINLSQKSQKSQKHNYICSICNKVYKDNSGLWRHKKKCKEEIIESIPAIDKDLIMLLIKENSELKHMMIEQQNMVLEIAKNGTHNNTTNSHNKSFNLQFFLNETCKDAINITDFVNSLQLQLSDLERVGELGYVEGISKIIINNLKDLDITLRPVHCTDKKRETIYIKDEDKWEKDEEKKKMHKFIKRVADKNARLLPNFKERYPDYNKASSIVSDQYNKILVESMGGFGDDDYEKEEKIIKRVSKEVIVEKI